MVKTVWTAALVAGTLAAVIASLGTAWLLGAGETPARDVARTERPAPAPRAANAAPAELTRTTAPGSHAPTAQPADEMRVDALEERLAAIEAQLQSLARRPVGADAGTFDPETVRGLLSELLQAESAEARPDEATMRAELEEVLTYETEMRAAWIARELELSEYDQAQLLPFFREEMDRRREVEELVGTRNIPPEELLERMAAIDDWKHAELILLFGEELGAKLADY